MEKALKKKAYDEIMGIYRGMARAGVPMGIVPFRMSEIMKEYGISMFEVSMLRREVQYEIDYQII